MRVRVRATIPLAAVLPGEDASPAESDDVGMARLLQMFRFFSTNAYRIQRHDKRPLNKPQSAAEVQASGGRVIRAQVKAIFGTLVKHPYSQSFSDQIIQQHRRCRLHRASVQEALRL